MPDVFRGFLLLWMGILIALATLCLVRCIRGPRIADRILSINMIGTIVIVMVCAMTDLLGEGYLVDIALLYALISLVSVMLLTKVYMGIYREGKHEQARLSAEHLAQKREEEA